MTCIHLLYGGPLVCDRPDVHDEDADTGHTYSSTSAGDAERGDDQ